MATVTGLTAERMLEIEAASIVDGAVVLDHLILKRHDDTEIDAGDVRGSQGIQGVPGDVWVPPAWQAWAPVYDGGTMTVTDGTGGHPSGNLCRYMVLGKTCFVQHGRVLNKGGTASGLITLTLPVAPKYGRAMFAATADNGIANAGIFDSFAVMSVMKPPAWDTGVAAFALGAHWIAFNGFYEIN